ncbi:hypothetical protein QVD17_37511 [Tagetes erecta]|uniref:Uncharacterized protein n=1 Tax=Tagetes erecta TaxID=13708 RepID=A0AAD8JW57_TARER|nr:hypothetical protein QVD17_37511 [Tagetes erecta]
MAPSKRLCGLCIYHVGVWASPAAHNTRCFEKQIGLGSEPFPLAVRCGCQWAVGLSRFEYDRSVGSEMGGWTE